MKPTIEAEYLAQGQALLSQLPAIFSSSFSTARLEKMEDTYVVCSFDVPGIGRRTTTAESTNEAIRLAIVELASLLPMTINILQAQKKDIDFGKEVEKLTSTESTERFQSKVRQQTVGVTLPTSLKTHLNELAQSIETSFADVLRKFATFGFEDFVDRSLYASSSSIFDLLTSELQKWQDSDSEQVMLRLEPGHVVRFRSAAKKYGKSVSELAALSIAHGLVMQELLVALEKRVESSKGAAIRKLLPQLGLEQYAIPLLSSVLTGSVRPPKKLLSRLAGVFEAPESLLSTFFRRSFDQRPVPAFKAENGKPEIRTTSSSWTTAVKSLNLPPEQAKSLFDLGV